MIRAFLAFDISEEVRQSLWTFLEPITSQTKGIKWVEPQNYHVTLKFFGTIDEMKMLEPISKVIEENIKTTRPVSLACKGIGCFPKWDAPRVVWAGLEGEAQSLLDLQKGLEGAFEKLGFPKENREFRMHLTLARIKVLPKEKGWLQRLESAATQNFGRTVVDHLILYKSQLTKAGSIYTAVEEFRFPT